MKKTTHKPGDLLKMLRGGGKGARMAMKAAGIKHSGSFHGKSNVLGHGGRAAQLKAHGVPGGVIGALARRAQAAPGQKNYHGKKGKKYKAPIPDKQNLGLALKKSHRAKTATHIHVHFHSDAPQGTKLEHREESKHEFKKSKHMKRKSSSHGSKYVEPKEEGSKEERMEEGKKEFKKSHKCKGKMCKHSSHKRKAAPMMLKTMKNFAPKQSPGNFIQPIGNAPKLAKRSKKKVHRE